MDPIFVEFAKSGPLVLAFGIMLVSGLSYIKRLSTRLDENSDQLVGLVKNNTEVMRSLKDALDRRPCLSGDDALKMRDH